MGGDKGFYEQERETREAAAAFMRRLYAKDLTSCSGGNLSVRAADDRVFITPSALDKGELTADQMVLVTLDGKNLSPHVKPTMELSMHLSVYRARPDVKAVVHAHPTFATAFSCMELDIETALTYETLMVVRDIAKVAFHPAGTDDLAGAVAKALTSADVALMRNHGVVAVGPTLLKAFDRLEVAEVSAKMTWIAKTMNDCRPLGPEERNAIIGLT